MMNTKRLSTESEYSVRYPAMYLIVISVAVLTVLPGFCG